MKIQRNSTFQIQPGNIKKEENNGVLGKMKNETGSKVITEFLALSPKSYAYKYCGKETKKAKGVALAVSEKQWTSTTIVGFLSQTTHKQDRSMEFEVLTNNFFNVRRQSCFKFLL